MDHRRILLAVLVLSAGFWSAGRVDRAAAATRATTALTPASFQLQWTVGPLPDQFSPIAESSPGIATFDGGGPAVVVGDRAGALYAYHLSDGTPVAGWPAFIGVPIDSTPSTLPLGTSGLDEVLIGGGNAFEPGSGGYVAFGPSGRPVWSASAVNPPTDNAPASGVQASITITSLQGRPGAFAGTLGQVSEALSAEHGTTLSGWPFFSGDSVFSTAAAADLYGTGDRELVLGGASTRGEALSRNYPNGGHLRILNSQGGLICDFETNQEVDSSPAIGAFLNGGYGIVVGTGSFYGGASDTDTVQAFDPYCHRLWSTRVDGVTGSSPALADVLGSGRLDVVEGTDFGRGGSVWVIDAATGQPVWHTPVSGRVIGSVVTADLSGQGYQDLIVPTVFGTDIVDGRSGAVVTVLTQAGFQNSPLVTIDRDGQTGITLAGYTGTNQGVIYHYEVAGSNGAVAVGRTAWPMFHHDPQLTGVAPVPGVTRSIRPCDVPAAVWRGYQTVARDGGVFSFGRPYCGSAATVRLTRPIVGAASAPGSGGYWMVASDGGVFTFGGARFFGSTGHIRLTKPVVAMASTPDGRGYWMVGSDGGVFAFGDARFYGSTGHIRLNSPIVGMAATVDGRGYWLATADGGVFAFGDAQFLGSAGNKHLARPIVAIAEDRGTGGYWLVGSDGGVLSYNAYYFGSAGAEHLSSPVVGMASTEDGLGYWLVGADGGIFSFGDARFRGSTGALKLRQPIVGVLGWTG
jgi:hypothetical protein